jgi:hypothetical protein
MGLYLALGASVELKNMGVGDGNTLDILKTLEFDIWCARKTKSADELF